MPPNKFLKHGTDESLGIYMFRGMRPPECGVAIYTLKYIYTNK